MERAQDLRQRLERMTGISVKNWQHPAGPDAEKMDENAIVDMGWGNIIFGHTFQSMEDLYAALSREKQGRRDIAFYLRDPHVLLSMGPEKLFLDPSHTYRLWAHDYGPSKKRETTFTVRRAMSYEDAQAMNRIYASRKMVTCDPDFLLDRHASRMRTYLVAESLVDGQIIGTVTGIDHVKAFNDPEGGAGLWCLAVDPQTHLPGVGESLVRQLVEHFFTRGRSYVDLSVMHDNEEAICLYEKLGFQRVPVFCVKCKNQINERLFVSTLPEEKLNPYARLITDEARRRGISVEVIDEENAYFNLVLGGRTITCRESLTEMTSAIAMSRCDDKRLTHRVLKSAGIKVPMQLALNASDSFDEISCGQVIEKMGSVVVKPARGEQGNGISVDIRTPHELAKAIDVASRFCPDIVIEEYTPGHDLRTIVIDYELVAAAVRKPPMVTGTGMHTVKELIDKYNRRRQSATGGESHVPLDEETERCVRLAGYEMDNVVEAADKIQVRKTANLHTGGTIHDVTYEIHPALAQASIQAAKAIGIPVTGLDLMVPDLLGSEYVIIEANERPGLANHEPQPTAQRFIDYLFPQTSALS